MTKKAAPVALYQCDNLIEAHLLKGMLEQCGIGVELDGESLVGGMGELPAAGLLVLRVAPEETQRARALIEDYERQAEGDSGARDSTGHRAGGFLA